MTVYEVIFHTVINADSKEDLNEKAEKIAENFSKILHKKVIALGYQSKDEITEQQKLM